MVGFGGYVALPAYLAARGRVPIVVHEANARAGLANKIGARFAVAVAAAVDGSGLKDARVVGNPVRRSLSDARPGGPAGAGPGVLRAGPRTRRRCWSSAGRRARSGSTPRCQRPQPISPDAGVGVLHAYGRKNEITLPDLPAGAPPYVAVPYLDRMDLAYAAADLVLARSGAMTVAEIGAVGLPAVYVPAAARQR